MSLLDSVRAILNGRRGPAVDMRNLLKKNAERLSDYDRYRRLYDGIIVRQSENGLEQVKDIAFALGAPIVNTSADFLAGHPISFKVRNADGVDAEATKAAGEIWARSGAESKFLPAAIRGGIYGDVPIVIRRNDKDEVYLDFPSAELVYPVFDPNNVERITRAVIGYMTTSESGERSEYYEEYSASSWYRKVDGVEETGTYNAENFDGGVPVLWIRNLGIGETFGRSDLKPLKRLLERYDHAGEKELDIIDYYSSPNVVAKGVTVSELQRDNIPFGFRRLFAVKETANLEYLEWKGDRPDVEKGIEHLRQAIAEIAEVPSIAFGHTPTGLSQITGVALKILYGPLLAKTRRKRANYGPVIERAMMFALREAGFKIESEQLIDISWPDPTPVNEVEKWEVAAAKQDAGLSRAQSLREAGYDDEQLKAIEDERSNEKKADTEDAMSAFNAGNVRDPASTQFE
ncbi:portal protein [Caudoviricetes sp.]|nr:portal protein [Caudoviricetes sp.]